MVLRTYPVPRRNALRLDANTNLYGPNPAVKRALAAGAGEDLQQYPSGHSDDLISAICRRFRVRPAEVVVGNGSDELIDMVVKAFVNPGESVVVPTPSFVMYPFYGRVNAARVIEVPLRKGFQLDVEGILGLQGKVTFLASPNNPTGNAWPERDLERIIAGSPDLVVIDEAYAEFCGQNFATRFRRYDNLIVLRTLSKGHGLAGLRVGFAFGPAGLTDRVRRVKPPFSVGTLAERIAVEALRDEKYVRESGRMVAAGRRWLDRALRRLGVRPCPTDANFMMVDLRRPAAPVVRALERRGVLVRDMGDFHGLQSHIRTTIGRPEHNARLVDELGRVLR